MPPLSAKPETARNGQGRTLAQVKAATKVDALLDNPYPLPNRPDDGPWGSLAWSQIRRRRAAFMVACGVKPSDLPSSLEVGLSTVREWVRDPEFLAMVEEGENRIVDMIDQRLVAEIGGALFEMLDLWRKMVRGEVEADDPRIERIQSVVITYLYKWIALEVSDEYDDDTPSAAKNGTRGQARTAVQVNVG